MSLLRESLSAFTKLAQVTHFNCLDPSLFHDQMSWHITVFVSFAIQCIKLISADMTKALVCVINSHVGVYRSVIHTLFGDPVHYAYKLGNDTFADQLPIHMHWLANGQYNRFHSLSIDYDTHKVYYSNKPSGRLEYGFFVHRNSTRSNVYYAVPETYQVTFTLKET